MSRPGLVCGARHRVPEPKLVLRANTPLHLSGFVNISKAYMRHRRGLAHRGFTQCDKGSAPLRGNWPPSARHTQRLCHSRPGGTTGGQPALAEFHSSKGVRRSGSGKRLVDPARNTRGYLPLLEKNDARRRATKSLRWRRIPTRSLPTWLGPQAGRMPLSGSRYPSRQPGPCGTGVRTPHVGTSDPTPVPSRVPTSAKEQRVPNTSRITPMTLCLSRPPFPRRARQPPLLGPQVPPGCPLPRAG